MNTAPSKPSFSSWWIPLKARLVRLGLSSAGTTLLTLTLGAPLGAQAAWTNGQAATVVLGAADFTTPGGGAASASQFTGPTDICTDATSGKVFVVLSSSLSDYPI